MTETLSPSREVPPPPDQGQPRELSMYRGTWFDPLSPVPLHEIQMLTINLLELMSSEEQCADVFRAFLKAWLDQVRASNVHNVNASLVVWLLQSSDAMVLPPLLEELKLGPYGPPELTGLLHTTRRGTVGPLYLP